ncbi:hypothetical protein [Sphingomonas nostoxanthinifaciens]|uniref:hypothetical protein n=1 Tax=Sphingomonas nostoxanthinifaciens TaxID=2872652 RepID=UPI001CC21589|nr:hypothetical protein [Sphingomonas nostoxanthinifaciens]UAK25844.1 hypothetical protein K8P63_06895 [Sphingomonas nostoxanthinifaciens]
MLKSSIFKAVADLVSGADARNEADHKAFLVFYRDLVETIPTEVCQAFGTLGGVRARTAANEEKPFGLQLSVADYLWWKRQIEEGTRFVAGPSSVQMDMLDRLTRKADIHRLTADERKALIALFDPA